MLGRRPCNFCLEAMAEAGVQPPPPHIPSHLTRIPPEVIQASPTSQPVRCDSDPKVHLVVSLVTKVHPVMQVLCTRMMRCRKRTQRRP